MARIRSQTTGLIKVRCPNPACKKILAVKAAMGGKKARCPLCGQTMAIPKVVAPKAKPAPEAKPVPKEKPSPPAPPQEQAAPPVEKQEKQEKEEKTRTPPPEKTPAPEKAAPPEEPAPPEAPPPEEKQAPRPEPEPVDPGPALPPTRPGGEPVMIGAPSPKGHPTPRTLERVAKEAAETGYELLGGQLRVVGAIGYDLNTGFRDKCDQLLATGEKQLTLDLSQVLYLSSSHIGVIARLATDAMGQERNVKVRVTGKVARVLRFAGIDRLVDLEDIDAG